MKDIDDLIAERESTPEGKKSMDEAREWFKKNRVSILENIEVSDLTVYAMQTICKQQEDRIANLERELVELRRYARHRWDCSGSDECTCGYDELITRIESEQKK